MNDPGHPAAVLFADICDSVRMYEQFGNERGIRIAEQSMDQMIRVTEANGGKVIRTQGDGVKSLFSTVDLAYDAAIRLQISHLDIPCAIKVAFSYGSVVNTQGDVFGDTVHLAARLLGIARPGEILMPGATAERLSAERRANTRLLDTRMLKGKSAPVDVFTVAQTYDEAEDTTRTVVTMSALDHFPVRQSVLVLAHPAGEFRCDRSAQAVSIGRADTCDLIVNSSYASRLHARIEFTRNGFQLSDLSTNGTYVVADGNEPVFIKRETIQLHGRGVISLGRPLAYNLDDVIRFHHAIA